MTKQRQIVSIAKNAYQLYTTTRRLYSTSTFREKLHAHRRDIEQGNCIMLPIVATPGTGQSNKEDNIAVDVASFDNEKATKSIGTYEETELFRKFDIVTGFGAKKLAEKELRNLALQVAKLQKEYGNQHKYLIPYFAFSRGYLVQMLVIQECYKNGLWLDGKQIAKPEQIQLLAGFIDPVPGPFHQDFFKSAVDIPPNVPLLYANFAYLEPRIAYWQTNLHFDSEKTAGSFTYLPTVHPGIGGREGDIEPGNEIVKMEIAQINELLTGTPVQNYKMPSELERQAMYEAAITDNPFNRRGFVESLTGGFGFFEEPRQIRNRDKDVIIEKDAKINREMEEINKWGTTKNQQHLSEIYKPIYHISRVSNKTEQQRNGNDSSGFHPFLSDFHTDAMLKTEALSVTYNMSSSKGEVSNVVELIKAKELDKPVQQHLARVAFYINTSGDTSYRLPDGSIGGYSPTIAKALTDTISLEPPKFNK